jgi:hypothetical protein
MRSKLSNDPKSIRLTRQVQDTRGSVLTELWPLVFILLLAIAVLGPELKAAEVTPEASRWARRALLDDAVRKHLQLDVGEVDPLGTVLFTPCDFEGQSLHAVALRHGETTVVSIQRNLECLGRCAFRTTGALSLTTQVLAGQTWVFVDETEQGTNKTTTLRRLLNLRGGELAVRQSWTQSLSQKIGKRFERVVQSTLRADVNALVLTTTTADRLDEKTLQDAEAEQVLRLTPQPDGSLRTEVERDRPVTAAVKLRHARTLEREHLEEPALMLAKEARDQTDKLPAGDARRTDASALVARLEARNPVQVTQKDPGS